jgi:hypothetical protein
MDGRMMKIPDRFTGFERKGIGSKREFATFAL